VKPLDGVKVVDLSRILAGPYCSMLLADMGAEVVKVENPDGGDDTRAWGPPFLEGESTYFLSINRNKKSLTLNLKDARGKDVLGRLIARGDVLLENFRPGTLERLGFGYEAVRALNPRMIYCSVSGFGQTGPDAQRPGYDLIAQGESGLMSITGFPDGPPLKVGTSIADIYAGTLAAQGILLALLARERTGRGQQVDVALLDGMLSVLTYQAGSYFATGNSPGRRGNQHPSITPYEAYEASDGHLNIGVANNSLYEKFCKVLGREDLITDPRFRTDADRVNNRAALAAILVPLIKARTVKAWLEALDAAGVPAGAIRSVGEALSAPQALAREMVVEVAHPKIGPLKVTGVPVRLSETPGAVATAPPLLGQHTDEVLRAWLGLSPQAIADLRSGRVI
jgi:crotonobetainyl-CoA:carnitine CoA-transferase CaiB-like acyl-CoA transferase